MSGVDHEPPINKNHSDMVKFEPEDPDYGNVKKKLRGIAERALVRKIAGTSQGLIPAPRWPSNVDHDSSQMKRKKRKSSRVEYTSPLEIEAGQGKNN